MAGNDTTQKSGVPGSDRETGFVDESKDRPLTPREEALAAIKTRRLEEFNDELEEGGGERVVFATDPNADPDEAAAPAAAPPAVEPPPAAKKDDAAAPAVESDAQQLARQTGAIDPKTPIKVKVDGVEIDVPFEQVVSNYQKQRTADERLRTATEDADRIRREAMAGKSHAEAPAPAETPPAAAVDGKKFTAALFEGDEDGALGSLSELIEAGVKKAIEALPKTAGKPTDDEVAAIEERVTQRIESQRVLKQSQDDYPELYSDPDVQALGRMKIERRMNEGVPFADALHAVETEMAGKMGWKKPTGRQDPASSVNRDVLDKAGKKVGLDALPTATARRAAPEDAEPILDENLRAARGIDQLRAGRPGQQQA